MDKQMWKCNNEIKSENAGNEIWMKHKWNCKRNLCLWEGRRSRDSVQPEAPGDLGKVNLSTQMRKVVVMRRMKLSPRKWHCQKFSHWKNSERYFTTWRHSGWSDGSWCKLRRKEYDGSLRHGKDACSVL